MAKKIMFSHESFDREDKVKLGSNKNFGLTFAALFFIIAFGPLLFHHTIRWWGLPVSALFLVLSFFAPNIFATPKILWAKFGLLLNSLISPIILAVLFFLVFFPIGYILKIFGKDVLNIKSDKTAMSHWIASEKVMTSMRDQF